MGLKWNFLMKHSKRLRGAAIGFPALKGHKQIHSIPDSEIYKCRDDAKIIFRVCHQFRGRQQTNQDENWLQGQDLSPTLSS